MSLTCNGALPPYKSLLLLRLGEIALKGLNRNRFENQLLKNLRYRLEAEGDFRLEKRDSRVWIQVADQNLDQKTQELMLQKAQAAAVDVFGFVSLSPVRQFACELEVMELQLLDMAKVLFEDGEQHSFKLEVRRVNKKFPLNTYELACHMGDLILDAFPEQASVDVHDPEITFYLEVRQEAYLYHEIIPARAGLPVGMGGKGLVMLSGGIDSPVAAYLMASRGMRISAIYFHTYPYTSNEAKDKVVALAQILTRYTGDLDLYVVDFTECQLALNEHVPEDMMTIVMRRMMVRIACGLARELGIPALITGESLGQVASQTVEGLSCTNKVSDRPIFRPLIGLDKEQIIRWSRDIGCYETSILPYEDCCTVFVARHPKTHPSLRDAEQAESNLKLAELIKSAIEKTAKISLQLK
ncbi:MAG: tRNA uracil 4-sulfurtransferase ThiI [Eubacteriales bacterium]|nr:tRNA uracil 4-sulfurtransferase ThiI [Eubacteriales bacterium]